MYENRNRKTASVDPQAKIKVDSTSFCSYNSMQKILAFMSVISHTIVLRTRMRMNVAVARCHLPNLDDSSSQGKPKFLYWDVDGVQCRMSFHTLCTMAIQ